MNFKTKSGKRIIFIMVTMFLNFLGFSILFPILPFIVGKYESHPHDQALYIGLLLSVYSLCQFISSPGLGALSDRFGRKPVLLLSLFGSVVGYLILAFAGSLWMLFLGRIIDGLTGGNISTIYAYMADISKPHERVKYFGLLGAAGGAGMIFGPVIGGFGGSVHLSVPLILAAFITFIDIIFGYYFLDESLPSHLKTIHFDFKHLNPFRQFSRVLNIPALRRLLLMGFIFFMALTGMYGTNGVFLKDVFSWNTAQIGFLLFIIGFIDIISQGYLINKLLPRFGEENISIFGLILTALGFFMTAFTPFFRSTLLVYVSLIILNLGDGLFEPSQGGLVSKSIGPEMQGRVQGANQGMQSVARVIGPLVASFMYFFWSGLPYLLESVMVVVSLIIFMSSLSVIRSSELAVLKNQTLRS